MNLPATQRAFQSQVLSDDAPLPPGWDARMAAGLDIYRNAYRSRLMDALRETYPKTLEWVGEEAFAQAAAHHLITNPPSSWTLDQAGDGFPATLAPLFASDPEVEELAWLEWAMQHAFTAEDCTALDPAGFAAATCQFDDGDWAHLTLAFVPGLISRPVGTACAAIWKALAEGAPPPEGLLLGETTALLVWRDGFSPVFRDIAAAEAECVALMRGGMSFGTLCDRLIEQRGSDDALGEAGAMLGRWIDDRLLTKIERAAPCGADAAPSHWDSG